MAEKRNFDVLDFFVLIIKWKKFFLIQGIITLLIVYLSIFFFVEEKWDSSALVIPAEQSGMGGIASLLGGFSDLPIDIGNFESNPTIAMYETVVYSRTIAEKMIAKFNLNNEYKEEYREKIIEAFQDHLETEETESGGYRISIRSNGSEKSAEMVNYLLQLINNTLIELNIEKSRDNRIFLEGRFNDIKNRLRVSENNLAKFQDSTKIYVVEDQLKATIETFSSLDADLAKKEIEREVIGELYGKKTPQYKNLEISVDKLREKIKTIKNNNSKENLLLEMQNLPENAKKYLRLYREVTIYNSMLEFIIPLYEQAKFEEQKDIPVMQIIDYAVPSEQRAYPKRVVFSIGITLIIELMLIIVLLIRYYLNNTQNEKIIFIRKNALNFRNK